MGCFFWKPKWPPQEETDPNTPINQTCSERWYEGRLVTKGGAPPTPSSELPTWAGLGSAFDQRVRGPQGLFSPIPVALTAWMGCELQGGPQALLQRDPCDPTL